MVIKAKKNHILIALTTIALFVVFDQLIKLYISINLNSYDYLTVIKNFFWIRIVHNSGAAFSILEGKLAFFIVITIIALAVFVFMFLTTKNDKIHLGLTMMIGGTIGNAIDRIRLGYVVDYLDFNIFGYSFPVFNFADILLTIGVVITAIGFLKDYTSNE